VLEDDISIINITHNDLKSNVQIVIAWIKICHMILKRLLQQ